jgi:hypothetical protein
VIQGTSGYFGTGIWPYRLSRFIEARNMRVESGRTNIDYLSRDYLSVLYLPIFPLGLSALVSFGHQRLFLDRDGKAAVVGATMSVHGSRERERERRLARVRASWLLAFIVTVCGVAMGVWVGGYFANSWQPGLLTVLGGLLGCCIMNRLYLAAIG